jgi:maltooligosyltrehalose trehalohydrolase
MKAVKRQHRMPFGAELLEDGRVRFRLWAPGARSVAVCLGSGAEEAVLPMAAEAEGWFGLITDLASTGTRYRYQIDDDLRVPDPASRFQPEDVHGPSEVVDPCAWDWQDAAWRGRPWTDTVLYELHVGSFTSQGDFAGVREKLDYLVDLGVTAIELMPVADFAGTRNWGYDGVFLFAPEGHYGRPEHLKALIEAAHQRGLMVFLDVVYNHFGPEGNYLHAYAPQFFTERHHTPWGAAINYDGDDSLWVRQFFIHNALYWLEEYHLDGLRFDAVHAIVDDSEPDILTELAERVHQTFRGTRHIHLVLENDHNAAHYLVRNPASRPQWYAAQWNDDIHHALHATLTGETGGYYVDYADGPVRHLARCLCEGFAYQGERSAYRDHAIRGEPSTHLPALAFVSFLQNHDQIGNRAFGERITALTEAGMIRAAVAIVLLAPSPPLLFMGEEWGATQPFPFFCDFGDDLAESVVAGRRAEFARFEEFSDPAKRQTIPDPMALATFASAVLEWDALEQAGHRAWYDFYHALISLRRRSIVPRLEALGRAERHCELPRATAVRAQWSGADGTQLTLSANLDDAPLPHVARPPGELLYCTSPAIDETNGFVDLPAWCTAWWLYAMPAPP